MGTAASRRSPGCWPASRPPTPPAARRASCWWGRRCGADRERAGADHAPRLEAAEQVLAPGPGAGPGTADPVQLTAREETPVIVPSRSDFRALARSGKLVPVYREVFADHDTPVSAFRKIDDGSFGFLLESVEGGEKWGRYSLLGSRPSLVFTARGEHCEIRRRGVVTPCARTPLEELADLVRAHQAVALPGLPRFCGGAVGFFGYDGA